MSKNLFDQVEIENKETNLVEEYLGELENKENDENDSLIKSKIESSIRK